LKKIHLMLLWHMHQPEYRDPATGQYILPWTRLHALKDYWGMVHLLREFPNFHATVNVVPSLGSQLEEYASGKFNEPWFDLAFMPAEQLTLQQKGEILDRAFQLNHEHLMSRWIRFLELYGLAQTSRGARPVETFSLRDWRDLQLLSQLAWMDEYLFAGDPLIQRLSAKGLNFTEEEKQQLRTRQLEFLKDVLPEYRRAGESGQIELSTTPYFHPILPLICDSDTGHESNPHSERLQPPFRHPEDARVQLQRARDYHQRVFGAQPAGLWPSEGSVSNQALELAADMGFRWFGTDEGVLGRTLGLGFGRDGQGYPANAERMYSPLQVNRGGLEITGFFRDHYISDLVGFVYSRMTASAAAEDLHLRLRTIGERISGDRPATVSIILDGENAWEYFPGNGREFLRQFYRRVSTDPDIRALTASEALQAAGEIPSAESVVPGSWINANFDVWIGSSEDRAAWNLLRDARDAYSHCEKMHATHEAGAPDEAQLSAAYDALLAAEGSDWCWWYGPEHSTANDLEFDAFYRTLLTEVYLRLGLEAPDALAEPIKHVGEAPNVVTPQGFLNVKVDGRNTSYFEWLGAGYYTASAASASMHGRAHLLRELYFGFDQENLFLRVDPAGDAAAVMRDEGEFRISIHGGCDVRIHLPVAHGELQRTSVEVNDTCPLGADRHVKAAYSSFLEVSIARGLLEAENSASLSLGVSLWHGGLPVDTLPPEGSLSLRLGADYFSWQKK
jgi:alpha-amylase/alpha-mannosidase (GH57 family)